MKSVKELSFADLTVKQKLGLVLCGGHWKPLAGDNLAFHLQLIREHALGAVWVSTQTPDYRETIRILCDAADYPLLICTDAESGYGDYTIGKHIAIGYTGSEKDAYAFGRVTGYLTHKDGFDVVCNPLLDRTQKNVPCGGVVRTLGPDKETVSRLAAAIARGMRDSGVLTVAKHYPSVRSDMDTHMAEGCVTVDEETLVNENLYPYFRLMEDGLLDGIMVGHSRLPLIDPDYPASLSEKVKNVIRNRGFDGFMITDALDMMGVVAKFGEDASRALAVNSGNDLALAFAPLSDAYASLERAYASGDIPDAVLDRAVKRVLAAQHKAAQFGDIQAPTEAEFAAVRSINRRCIAAITDPGVSVFLPTDGKHFFVILSEREVNLNDPFEGKSDTMSVDWYHPEALADHIRRRFPASGVFSLTEFPPRGRVAEACLRELDYDDIVFITFFKDAPYVGAEHFTPRILSLMEAWQVTNRIRTVIHFGNPFLLEDIPHVPCILNGSQSYGCTLEAINILAGDAPAEGTIPYPLHLK